MNRITKKNLSEDKTETSPPARENLDLGLKYFPKIKTISGEN